MTTRTNSLRYPIIILCCLLAEPLLAASPKFELHYIHKDPSWLTSVHQVVLADFDKDGDLDWTVGNAHKNPNFYWYQYKGPDNWMGETHDPMLRAFQNRDDRAIVDEELKKTHEAPKQKGKGKLE